MSTKARTAAGNLRDSGIPLQEAHGMSTMLISLTFPVYVPGNHASPRRDPQVGRRASAQASP